VLILLQFKSGKLVLEITDDGIGFDQNKKVKNDSYGLIGMKERAFLLDGQLSMLSQPGNGTSLKIEMSYKIEKVYS
jgi:two-component system sensor histidine kinase DegS